MKKIIRYYFYLILISLGIIFSCTTNPFSKDEDNIQNTQMVHGNVILNDNSTPDSIYVWLESFDIGTFTDSNGNFKLMLPAIQEQSGGGVTGIFKLYFYVVNYRIQYVETTIRNGVFVFGESGLGDDGRLKENVKLVKLLEITASVSPATIPADFKDSLYVTVTLKPYESTVSVSAYTNNNNIINGVFIRNQYKKNKLFGSYMMSGSQIMTHSISSIALVSTSSYKYNVCEFPKGDYELIPFILVNQNDIPVELINNFTPYPLFMEPRYLDLPIKRKNAFAHIEHCDHGIEDPP